MCIFLSRKQPYLSFLIVRKINVLTTLMHSEFVLTVLLLKTPLCQCAFVLWVPAVSVTPSSVNCLQTQIDRSASFG